MTERIRDGTIEHDWEKYYQLREGDIFVEVGGFWGRYAVQAARQKCSRIVLVEPSPENARKAQGWNEAEGLKNVSIFQVAVSDHKGEQQFIVEGNPSGHRLDNSGGHLETTTVQTDTLEGILDSLSIDHVDLLASDCEGQEVNLVKFGGRWLREKLVRNVAIGAYHGDHLPPPTYADIVVATLRDYGYQDVKYEDGVAYGHS